MLFSSLKSYLNMKYHMLRWPVSIPGPAPMPVFIGGLGWGEGLSASLFDFLASRGGHRTQCWQHIGEHSREKSRNKALVFCIQKADLMLAAHFLLFGTMVFLSGSRESRTAEVLALTSWVQHHQKQVQDISFFLNWWLMWQGPTHCGRCHPCTGGCGWFEKVN